MVNKRTNHYRSVFPGLQFFFEFVSIIGKGIIGNIAVFMDLAECFHPFDIVLIQVAVVVFAVFSVRNAQHVLHYAVHGAIRRTVGSKIVKPEWNQIWELRFNFFHAFHKTCWRAEIRFADGFIDVFTDNESIPRVDVSTVEVTLNIGIVWIAIGLTVA